MKKVDHWLLVNGNYLAFKKDGTITGRIVQHKLLFKPPDRPIETFK